MNTYWVRGSGNMHLHAWLQVRARDEREAFEIGYEELECLPSPMLCLALDIDNGLRALNDMKAEVAIPILRRAVSHITAPENRAAYEAMKPDNGWGSHKGTVKFLRALLAECEEHPATVIDIG